MTSSSLKWEKLVWKSLFSDRLTLTFVLYHWTYSRYLKTDWTSPTTLTADTGGNYKVNEKSADFTNYDHTSQLQLILKSVFCIILIDSSCWSTIGWRGGWGRTLWLGLFQETCQFFTGLHCTIPRIPILSQVYLSKINVVTYQSYVSNGTRQFQIVCCPGGQHEANNRKCLF